MNNKDLVLKAIEEAGKPLKNGEISEITGIDKKEVSNIIKKFKEEEIVCSPKRCYYDIKK